MKRIIIAVILVFSLVLTSSNGTYIPQGLPSSYQQAPNSPEGFNLQAEAQGLGSSVPTVQYMDRIVTEQMLSISNSFSDPSTHSASIDLSPYQIPGWTLYEVQVDVDNITAIAEREVLGVAMDTTGFRIDEYNDIFNWNYNSLAQGFYEMPHDGQLLNYSFYYESPIYTPAQHGWAYYSVLSDYQNSSSNLVGYTQLPTRVISGAGWENAMVGSIILDADTEYYAVINGSALTKTTFYPDIYWIAETAAGAYTTQQFDSRFSLWGDYSCEALLNYTYTPWNTTADTALVFSNPNSISLNVDGAPVSGSTWTTSSASNITSLQIATNQSVNVFHNLTLSYKKDVTAATNWNAVTSGALIDWNVTIDLVYPVVPETVIQFMNITNIPIDWTATGLYLGTVPGGSYSNSSSNVTCNALSDGTWTLTSTAPNYVTGLALSDSSDSSPIINKVANLVIMDIDATISQSDGSANLLVLQSSNLIFSLEDNTIVAGAAAFQWDISSTTDGNDTHSVEVYWISADGLEAGYMTQEVFVFHSTTLVADETYIEAFTDSTFNIGIDFDETSPARGLDAIPADVLFSVDGGANTSMLNPSGGRWTWDVDTTGMTNDIHFVTVYAEGYALENQSLVITVDLDHHTQALNWSWSDTNDIAYLDSTNLTVSYWDLSYTGISDAIVNITFDATTYNLTWDAGSGNYWIQLNGSDFAETNGTTTMVLQAWNTGYVAQYNDTISITIHEESTGIGLVVNWNPIDRNISYIESITITASYTYNSNPITDDTDLWPGVSVYITFSGHPLENMVYNATSLLWEVTLDGSDYLGITTVTIRAIATGYAPESSIPVDMIVVEDIPILTNSWTDSAASTDYAHDIDLAITVTDSIGSFINDAILSVNVFGTDYPMSFVSNGRYEFTIPISETRGSYVVNVTMVRIGYTTSNMLLGLTVRATTAIVIDYLPSEYEPWNQTVSEYEQWNLTVTVTYTDTIYPTPIANGTVTVTIDGVEFTLTYDSDSGVYIAIILLDFEPGTYPMSVEANATFCNEATASPYLHILEKSAVYLSLTTEGDPSLEGQRLEIIATLTYNESQTAVVGADIRFIVTINYVNGTVEVRDDVTQYDTTNNDGVASWGFEIPSGNIDRISIHAEYDGNRINWETSLIHELSAGTNPLMLVLSFFFLEPVGQMLVLSIVILGVVATAYNKRVKPKKRAARASLENQLQMFRDLESLRHFMAVYLDRGTCVFYHPFTDERIQPDLISGFIAAITSVYGEIKGDGVRGTLEEIQYHGLRLNSYSGEFIIGILILEGDMTPLLKERLQFFVELFENQYDQDLTEWNGLIDCFDPEWVVSTLSSTFNYSWLFAHRFGPTQKVGKTDARILDYISAVRDDRSEFHFRDLLTPLAEMLDITEAEVLDRLLVLQDRGVIAPVSIQTILQRQGMGLANGEIGAGTQLELPEKEEPKVDESELPAKESAPTEEPDKVEELVYDDDSLVEEKEEDKKDELDPMDEFVKDVESILTKKKDEKNGES